MTALYTSEDIRMSYCLTHCTFKVVVNIHYSRDLHPFQPMHFICAVKLIGMFLGCIWVEIVHRIKCTSVTQPLLQMNMVFIWPFLHLIIFWSQGKFSLLLIARFSSLVFFQHDGLADLCPLWPCLSLSLCTVYAVMWLSGNAELVIIWKLNMYH